MDNHLKENKRMAEEMRRSGAKSSFEFWGGKGSPVKSSKSKALKRKANRYATKENYGKYVDSGDSKYLTRKKPKGEHYALGEGWEELRK